MAIDRRLAWRGSLGDSVYLERGEEGDPWRYVLLVWGMDDPSPNTPRTGLVGTDTRLRVGGRSELRELVLGLAHELGVKIHLGTPELLAQQCGGIPENHADLATDPGRCVHCLRTKLESLERVMGDAS